MAFLIKQATLADLDESATLFNLYRIFYRQESDLEKERIFFEKDLSTMNPLFS